MAKKPTLTDIGNVWNSSASTSAAANNDAIQAAFDNTLSLDGSTPNSMEANLDMNSNKIVNVATPTAAADAVTKKYVDDLAITPSGSSIATYDGNGTFTGAQTFTEGVSIDLEGADTENALTVTVGASDDAHTTDMRYGYVGQGTTIYIDGDGSLVSGSADALVPAISGTTKFISGDRGIACGVYSVASAEGTWDPGVLDNAGAVGLFVDGSSSRGGSVFGIGNHVNLTANGTTALVRGMESDVICTVNPESKVNLELVSPTSDTGQATNNITVNGGNTTPDEAAIRFFSVGSGVGFRNLLCSVKPSGGAQPTPTNGTLWRAGGFTTTHGLDWRDCNFSGSIGTFQNDNHFYWRNAANSASIKVIGLAGDNTVTIGGDKFNVNPTSGATSVTGAFSATTSVSAPTLNMDASAGTSRLIRGLTGGSQRWQYGLDGDAESGSNAGSNFRIYRYSDAGSFLGTAISINRATGYTNIEGAYSNTTASAANMYVDANGLLHRSTSARKYKQDEQEIIDAADIVKAVAEASCRYRSAIEGDDQKKVHIGVIADDVAEAYPELVHFTENEVEGFAYERVVAPLCKEVVELRSKVETLEDRIAKLEALIMAK